MRMMSLALFLFFLVSSVHGEEKRYAVPLEDSPGYGQANAPVTIIEFVDYQ